MNPILQWQVFGFTFAQFVLIGIALVAFVWAALVERLRVSAAIGTIALLVLAWLIAKSGSSHLTVKAIPKVLAVLLAWFLIGTLWARFKLGREIAKSLTRHETAETDVANRLHQGDRSKLAPDERRELETHLFRTSRNKERVTNWVVLWPFSAFTYVFAEFVADAVRGLVDKLTGWFKRVEKRGYGDRVVD